jgi:aminopeptidase YwaD
MLIRFFFLSFCIFLLFFPASSQNSLQKDILFLTAKNLSGRYPGTVGDSLTQKYISDRFLQCDLLPFMNSNSYAQKFDYIAQYQFESRLQINNRTKTEVLKQGRDFAISASDDANIRDLKSVFIGYGIDRSCLQVVKNKAVVTYLSDPLPLKKNQKRTTKMELISAGAKVIVNIWPEGKNLPEQKHAGVYRHGNNSDSISILQLTKDKLNLFVTDKEINTYDSLAAINPSLLPSFIQSTSTMNLFVKRYDTKTVTANMIGLKKGTNDDFIIIGAHHDHLGKGKEKEHNLFYPGANDNASGIATLLYLAEKFKNIPFNCSILFIAFGAEEEGLLGSQYFVKNLPIKKEHIRAMINLDVMGQLKNDTLYYAKYNNRFDMLKSPQIVHDTNIILYEKDAGLSDAASFLGIGIPTLYFSTGDYKQLHSVEDTEKRINYAGMNQTAEFILNVIKLLDQCRLNQYIHNPVRF